MYILTFLINAISPISCLFYHIRYASFRVERVYRPVVMFALVPALSCERCDWLAVMHVIRSEKETICDSLTPPVRTCVRSGLSNYFFML
jgi:hypothetical protein